MICFAKEFDPLLIVLWESSGEERTAGGEGYRGLLSSAVTGYPLGSQLRCFGLWGLLSPAVWIFWLGPPTFWDWVWESGPSD